MLQNQTKLNHGITTQNDPDPLPWPPWHESDMDNQEHVVTFLPPNQQGESAKEEWTDDHNEFIAENEDNPKFITMYADGSLTKRNRRQQTGYGVARYYMGNKVFKAKGALGEQAKVYDAEMTGLCMAAEATKQFVLDRDWTQQPTHIVFYADNSVSILHIYKGTPGKAQKQSLTFRRQIKGILNKVKDVLIAISWVPRHSSIVGNKEADQLTKEGMKLRPDQHNHKTQAFMASLHKREMLEEWTHCWNNHAT